MIRKADIPQTPCFVIDSDRIRHIIDTFRKEFTDTCGNVVIGYSVKTNSLPYCISLAHSLGCKAEVVSDDEYRLARICGVSPSDIIYNGPMKGHDSFIEAVCSGSVVNIETHREIRWLADLPETGHQYPVGIRVNINLSRISPDNADGDDDSSRFGFSADTGELATAIEKIRTLGNVRIAGLHLHRTTPTRGLSWYTDAADFAVSIIRRFSLKPDYIDFGGGFNGTLPSLPSIAEYAAAIGERLDRAGLKGIGIIVEPGSAMSAWSMKFITSVIDVKQIASGEYMVNTDGSRNDIDPFWRKKNLVPVLEYEGCAENRKLAPVQTIGGCTCLENDRIAILTDKPLLQEGDRLIYDNTGAYTLTLAPMFIRMLPAVYALENGRLRLVQRRRVASDMILDGDPTLLNAEPARSKQQ